MLDNWATKHLEDLLQSNDAENPKHVADIIGQIVPNEFQIGFCSFVVLRFYIQLMHDIQQIR